MVVRASLRFLSVSEIDPVKLELIIELIVVLLAPPVYQYFLWRKGKTDRAGLIKTAKVFAPLYLLVLIALVAWMRS